MKDNFSTQAKAYAQFRPHYPPELLGYLLPLVPRKNAAWDCGTGNGQLAGALADHFEKVFATDISEQQLSQAEQQPNIEYSRQSAEKTSFADGSFDLVTVAQAIHWFRFHEFYTEVKRTLRPGGLLAVIGYGLVQTETPLQQAIDHFYRKVIGPYWDAERRYVDESYQTIPFPFDEIKAPAFEMEYNWTREQFLGYVRTWSAVKHYIQRNDIDPVDQLQNELPELWNERAIQRFTFPLLLRVGYNQD